MSSCAGMAPFKRIACRQAFERLRVPGDLRQRTAACLLIALSVLPPNQRLQLTPLRGHKIGAILKSRFGSTALRSIDAAQLKRVPFGGTYCNHYSVIRPVCHKASKRITTTEPTVAKPNRNTCNGRSQAGKAVAAACTNASTLTWCRRLSSACLKVRLIYHVGKTWGSLGVRSLFVYSRSAFVVPIVAVAQPQHKNCLGITHVISLQTPTKSIS